MTLREQIARTISPRSFQSAEMRMGQYDWRWIGLHHITARYIQLAYEQADAVLDLVRTHIGLNEQADRKTLGDSQ